MNFYADLWFWAFVIAVGTVPVLWIRSRQALRRRKSSNWHEIAATIHSIDVENPSRNGAKRVRISYSYFVGEYRSGEHYLFLTEELAYEVARLLKDASIGVLYNPRNPDSSTVTDNDLFAAAARILEREKLNELPLSSELQFDVAKYISTSKSDPEK